MEPRYQTQTKKKHDLLRRKIFPDSTYPPTQGAFSIQSSLSDIAILTFDAEGAERARVLRASLETKGYSIALADCQIAGTALAYDLTLVTNDSDLLRVPGLKVANWRSDG